MNVIAFNGSPRKTWNTATLLKNALDGAASQGASTELVHLYDLTYTGCTSCFACKLKGKKSYGRCAVLDELTPFLEKIPEADAIILGSPIYFGSLTGEMRSFMERLLFPYLMYSNPPSTLFIKKIKTAFFYTMNVSEQQMKEFGYSLHVASNANILTRVFKHTESLFSFETLQFEDYDKVVFSYFDPEERYERAENGFPGRLQACV